MAKALRHIERRVPDKAEAQAQALMQVMAAAAEQKDALLQVIGIVGELKKAGLLDLVEGMLKNRHEIGVIGINQMNKSGAQNVIKNAMSLVQFMGQLEPGRLNRVLGAVSNGLENAEAQPARTGGVWGMVRTIREPDMDTSLGWMMNFLRGMGEQLPQRH